jgi:hypothetical protein
MATPESKVKKKTKETLKRMDCYYAMTVTGGFGSSGTPDILVCYKGKFYGIECKAGKNKTTQLQNLHLDSIRLSGGVPLIINESNVDDLQKLMELAS